MYWEYVYNIKDMFPGGSPMKQLLTWLEKKGDCCHLGQSLFTPTTPKTCVLFKPSKACLHSLSVGFIWMEVENVLVVKLLFWMSRDSGDKHHINTESMEFKLPLSVPPSIYNMCQRQTPVSHYMTTHWTLPNMTFFRGNKQKCFFHISLFQEDWFNNNTEEVHMEAFFLTLLAGGIRNTSNSETI